MKRLRILYIAGPGDVCKTYKYWEQGKEDPTQANVTYSGQFYSVCEDMGATAYVLSSHAVKQRIKTDRFVIEHRSSPFDKAHGFLFHLGRVINVVNIFLIAFKFRPNYVLVSSGVHWFMLWPLVMLGIKIIPTIHCVLWLKHKKKSTVNKVLDFFNGYFFKYGCFEIMSASKDISRQLQQLNVNELKIHEFLPYYLRGEFDQITRPIKRKNSLKLLYVGRIVKEKGVFDLLEIYDALFKSGFDIELGYCGTGVDLVALKEEARKYSSVYCYNHCNKEDLFYQIGRSNAFVVPTTTAFVEGFNQVVVEGVLSGRPVITSDVCPAIEYVKSAVIECEPDNLQSYIDGIKKIYLDDDFYNEKCDACYALQGDFYNKNNSWGNVFKNLVISYENRK